MVEFGTAGVRGSVVDHATPAVALAVGQAVARIVTETESGDRSPPEVVIGRDGRTTGSALAAAAEAGVAAAGVRPVRIGQVPTPTLAFASRGRHGLMLTASHNPPTDNGIKCFADGSEFDREQERQIEEFVDEDAPPAEWDRWQSTVRADRLPAYREAVADYSRAFGGDCDGLRIAVDCGTGVAANATPAVLRELGATVIGVNATVDGHFSARPSKPTPETLSEFRQLLADGAFDLGIAHDGDGDRIVIVDSEGEIVHEDTVLAILAGYYTRQYVAEHSADAPTPVVVTTPNASGRIDEQVTAAGGRVDRVRLGGLHEGIVATGDDESVVFAAEPWKHIHPQLGGWIDGVASAAVIARLVADEGLPALREPITERPYRKVSCECPDERKSVAMEQLEDDLPEQFPEADVSFAHGIRLTFADDSWLLVRPSGTEPYIRLYAESDDVDALVETAEGVIGSVVDA
ncbi:phosphomannomutase [Halohasta litorea]|uniref:Phosphomannomutase n=1 Tax=Halohasta litorea TaxID=869891 RepID=A0ABD6DAK3_9EURY|nr:phosphomannomutase [Halohasta litorea]